MGSALSPAPRAEAANRRFAGARRLLARTNSGLACADSGSAGANRVFAHANRALALLLIVATLAASIGSGFACAKDTRSFPSMMQTLPISVADFTYWDIKALNSDQHLWDIFDSFEASASARQIEDLLVVLAKVQGAARAVSYDNATLAGPAAIFRGDFDMPYIRRQMEQKGYIRSANKEAETWLPGENVTYMSAVGIRGGLLYLGNGNDVVACISVAAEDSLLSMWDDPNLRVVADKLPDGFMVNIHHANPAHGEIYTGLVAYGKSYSKANRDTLKVRAMYLFGHDPAARAAQPAIEDHSRVLFDDVTVKTEGNLVMVTAMVPITRFAGTLEF